MNKGYQLIEPSLLDGLLGMPNAVHIAIPLLAWLIEALREELKEQLVGVQLELIRAEYQGPYPAIGVHYDSADTEDVGPLIEATIASLLRSRPTLDFASYVVRAGRDWGKEADDLLRQTP